MHLLLAHHRPNYISPECQVSGCLCCRGTGKCRRGSLLRWGGPWGIVSEALQAAAASGRSDHGGVAVQLHAAPLRLLR